MPKFNTYDVIVENASKEEALDFARCCVFSECEKSVCHISHARHVQDVDGISIWYEYCADYYFFTDIEEVDVRQIGKNPKAK